MFCQVLRHVHDARHVLQRHAKLRVARPARAANGQPESLRASTPASRCEICPSCLTTYWRTDFDRNPTTTNANGDAVADWAVTGGGTFDTTKLVKRHLDRDRRDRNAAARRLHHDHDRRSPLPQHERGRQRRRGSASTPTAKAASTRRSWSTCSAIGRHANAHAQWQNIRRRHQTAVHPHATLPSGFVRYRLTILPPTTS